MTAVIGLTGQSGSGKSFLSERFRERGIPAIDADRVSHQVTGENPDCLSSLRKAFGDEIFDPDGSLNRKTLGAVVFSDPAQLKLLNKTVFPFITREIERQIAAAESSGEGLLLLDAPTLYEAGADRFCCCVAAVCAPFDLRLERIMQRDGLSREAALLRLSAQNDDAFYRERVDFILYNNGTKEEFLQKADGLIDALIRRFAPPAIK